MIPCYCINDSDKPEEIPMRQWVKRGEKYHVTHVYKQLLQQNQLGFLLREINLKGCAPYNCYLSSRFLFLEKDLPKLIEMIEACGELNDLDISELINSQVKLEEV
jgi:hypothetical protein